MKFRILTHLIVIVSLTSVVLLPAGASPELAESCVEAELIVEGNQDILLQDAIRLHEQAKYNALSMVFPEDVLLALDQQLADSDLVVDLLPHDPVWQDESFSPGGGDATDPLRIAEEITKQGADGTILKELVEIAEGATPTLNTWLHMHETSKHRDYWTFYAQVNAYTVTGDCTTWQGNVSDMVSLHDRQAKTDGHVGVLELPLSQATDNVHEITNIEVVVRAIVCRYGWFSGRDYGCDTGEDEDNIKVQFLGAL